MSREIHPTALVDSKAEIGENVKIGPFCIIGPNAKIGDNNVFHSNVLVEGHTTIGDANEFFQFSSIGVSPQDKSYKNEPTRVIIGNNNIFRENLEIQRATTKQNHETIIGNNNYLMSRVHVAHDCHLGDNITMATACIVAGHVRIHDYVTMGGQCGAIPFMTLGKCAFIGAASAVDKDIPHFCAAFGNRIRLKGVNIIGLKRQGKSKEEISEVIDFYRMMESSALSPKAFVEKSEFVSEYEGNSIIKEMISFISGSEIGIAPFMS